MEIRREDGAFLAAGDESLSEVLNLLRIPARLVSGDFGPSPILEGFRALYRAGVSDAFTTGLVTGRLYWDRPPARGASRTPPVSRKFFPPRWDPETSP